MIAGNTIFAIGAAPGTAIVAEFIVSSAPKERSGAASALSETVSEFGGALGIALLGSLATFLYRSALGSTIPTDIPADAAETALRGIGPASSLAPTVGGGAQLLSAARNAYTTAADLALLAAAGIMLLTAMLAVAAFRNLKRSR